MRCGGSSSSHPRHAHPLHAPKHTRSSAYSLRTTESIGSPRRQATLLLPTVPFQHTMGACELWQSRAWTRQCSECWQQRTCYAVAARNAGQGQECNCDTTQGRQPRDLEAREHDRTRQDVTGATKRPWSGLPASACLFRLSICPSESASNPQYFRLCRCQNPVGTKPQKTRQRHLHLAAG